jgi:hypothetical protein
MSSGAFFLNLEVIASSKFSLINYSFDTGNKTIVIAEIRCTFASMPIGNLDFKVEAEKVIEQLNGSDLKDRKIVVNEARKRNEPLEIPIT